jgi:hypothetical protein
MRYVINMNKTKSPKLVRDPVNVALAPEERELVANFITESGMKKNQLYRKAVLAYIEARKYKN